MIDEAFIYELDGPPQSYFEIPLDYFVTPNGELEPAGHPEATRLVQRISYVNFLVDSRDQATAVQYRVKQRLKELGGGYLWWRKRPALLTYDDALRAEDDSLNGWWLRLGTTPQLPRAWWQSLSEDVRNRSTETNIAGLSP